jgi:hypothetical protein
MVQIALLAFILIFLAVSMLQRAWRVYQALRTGTWSMRTSQVRLAEDPSAYWRIMVLNGVTLAVMLCAVVFLIRQM